MTTFLQITACVCALFFILWCSAMAWAMLTMKEKPRHPCSKSPVPTFPNDEVVR